MADPRGYDKPVSNPVGSGVPGVANPGNPPQYPHYLKPIPINTRDIEAMLLEIMEGDEFSLARWLYSTWGAEAGQIKDQEIRNALRDGQLSQAWIERWRGDYATYVNDHLQPAWKKTMGLASGAGVPVGRFLIDLNHPEVMRWMDTRMGELITNLNERQHLATQNILRRFMSMDVPPSAREVGRYLRPVTGLYKGQEKAVWNYRQRLKAEGGSPFTVEHKVGNYAARLRRLRAETIARTEYSSAFNYGHFSGVRQARDLGLLHGGIVKIWHTAKDERVCPTCGPLHGHAIDLEGTFQVVGKTTYTPPAHPRCRCTQRFMVMSPNTTIGPEGVYIPDY